MTILKISAFSVAQTSPTFFEQVPLALIIWRQIDVVLDDFVSDRPNKTPGINLPTLELGTLFERIGSQRKIHPDKNMSLTEKFKYLRGFTRVLVFDVLCETAI